MPAKTIKQIVIEADPQYPAKVRVQPAYAFSNGRTFSETAPRPGEPYQWAPTSPPEGG